MGKCVSKDKNHRLPKIECLVREVCADNCSQTMLSKTPLKEEEEIVTSSLCCFPEKCMLLWLTTIPPVLWLKTKYSAMLLSILISYHLKLPLFSIVILNTSYSTEQELLPKMQYFIFALSSSPTLFFHFAPSHLMFDCRRAALFAEVFCSSCSISHIMTAPQA